MKIVDYCVVVSPLKSSSSEDDLTKDVVEMIKEGWQPLGGVSMVQDDGHSYGNNWTVIRFAQAMVKYEEGESIER